MCAASGCGNDDSESSAGEQLKVSAAASLKDAFTQYGETFGNVSLSFAGSDELAAQIRQGVKPDVFASANTTLPEQLAEEGLVEEPTTFAANRLVLAVPENAAEVGALEDTGKDGVTLAIGSESVPIGSYTRELLAKLGEARSERILANVRSEEPDVKGIVGKLTQGAVDAGFVYITDVAATDGELTAIELPKELQPSVAYGAAVVKDAPNPERAREFVSSLLAPEAQRVLREAGFEPPPP